jgi:Ankyrin repeat.
LEKLKTLVITKEYSINEQTPKKKLSSLHIAVMHKQLNCIKLLVMMGAELNIKNSSGLTPLDLALSSDDYKLETFTIKILRGEEIYPGMMNLKQDLQLTIPTLNPEKIKKVRCNDINDSFCIPKFSGKKSKKNIYKETEHY